MTSFNYYASNHFNNDLVNQFIFGGEITNDIKDFNQNKLGRMNVIGGEIEQKLEYHNFNLTPFKKYPQLAMTFAAEDINFFSANISSDLFSTVFYGNKSYLGDTMDFSFSHIQNLHFQKIGFGVIHKKTKSYVRLNFLLGNKSLNYRVGDSWLYSSPASDSISLNMNFDGYRTDTSKSYYEYKGYGFSFDFEHNFIYKDHKDRMQVYNLKLSNFGMVFWDDQTTFNYVDSTYKYSGFELSELLNRDSTSTPLLPDSLGILQKQQTKVEVLPFEISLQKSANQLTDQKLQIIYGLKALVSSDFRPYVFAGAYYAPFKSFSLQSRLAYGGFGGFKVGLGLNYFLNQTFMISLSSYDVIGYVSSKYGYGKSLNFALRLKL
jgi:hypothetical protein